MRSGLAIALFVLAVVASVAGASKKHHFEPHEEIPLYVSKIGPYSNPSETYNYYKLPFCRPQEINRKREGLGEVLQGNVMETSLYDLRFLVNVEWRQLCTMTYTPDDIKALQGAILKYYWFEMFYDELPMWGFVGTFKRNTAATEDGAVVTAGANDFKVKLQLNPTDNIAFHLFTHLHFSFSFNNDQVIGVNVTADRTQVQELDPNGMSVEFSYSSKWTPTSIPFKKRMAVYAKNSFFKHELEIHWLSIMNSCVLVVLLSGFLAIIVFRILRSDYERYAEEDEDFGWKLLHGDVFRFPPYANLFCALYGNGVQFFSLFFSLIVLAAVGVFYPGSRGSMKSAAVILYAVTNGVGGFVSARLYRRLNGENWVRNILLTATVFSVPFFAVWFITNTVATRYHATTALPFGTVVVIFLIWSLAGFPLTVIGGIAGKNSATTFDPPCRTKIQPRQIPDIAWYRQWPAHILMAGFLPFSAIYIELYYIFSALWGHKPYTLWGILILVFLILITVTACITVAMTYFQLATEDHQWWWRSFCAGGSTAFFVYGYAIIYYFYRSEMTGALQSVFYFGYMMMACYAFFCMLGAVGFFSSFVFVQYIYGQLKFN